MSAAFFLPYAFAKKHGLMVQPQAVQSGLDAVQESSPDESSAVTTLLCRAHCDPGIILELRRVLRAPIRIRSVSDTTFDQWLAQSYQSGMTSTLEAITGLKEREDLAQLMQDLPQVQDLLERQDDAPVIQLINALLVQAVKQRASDIHFEIFEEKLCVRFRIDGVLHLILEPPRLFAPLLISRLKVMAKLGYC